MSEVVKTVYTRRQELNCTEAELSTLGDKVLLDNELLYIHMNTGKVSIKMGDGITKVKDLPYVVDYGSIEALKNEAANNATAAAGSATTASNKASEATSIVEAGKTALNKIVTDGTATVNATRDSAVSTVNTTKSSAVDTVNNTKDAAVNTVNNAGNKAVDKINAIASYFCVDTEGYICLNEG